MAFLLFLQFLLHILMAQQLAYMEDPSILKVINNHDNWNLNSGKFTQKWQKILEDIDQCETDELWLDQNNNTTILDDIIHIKFKTLKFLCVSYNHIVSVQVLIYLRAPFLEELNLDSNQITTVRSLRKCRLPALQYISIADNPIRDVQTLCQMNNNLMRLDLEYESSNTIGESLSWIAKLRMTAMQRIYIEGESRIRNQMVPGMIMAKFTDIQIYEKQN